MAWLRKSAPAVLYILHSGNLYGTERMALATLEGMTEYDARVVVAPKPTGSASVTEAALQAGHRTVAFQTRTQLLRGVLPWFLRYRRIDVIGVGVGSSMICHLLGRLLFVRLRQLQVAHGGTVDWHAYGRKHLLNKIPIGIVAVSDFVRRKLLDHGVRADSLCVIENFLPDAQRAAARRRPPYDPAMPGARPADPARIKVAIVSRVDEIKRIDLLLDAVERQGLVEFEFDIYGTGEQLEAMRARSAALPNVRFHGFAGDVQDRLQHADLLLHLCPEEPFGLVVLEAFAAGLVVVVPDAGGAGSLVQDGITGLHFTANDVDALVRVLQAARFASGTALQRLADSAAALMGDRFSQAHGVQRYRDALNAAGAARGRPERAAPVSDSVEA